MNITLASAKVAAGYWGTQAPCDMPLRTIEKMLQHISGTERVGEKKRRSNVFLHKSSLDSLQFFFSLSYSLCI